MDKISDAHYSKPNTCGFISKETFIMLQEKLSSFLRGIIIL